MTRVKENTKYESVNATAITPVVGQHSAPQGQVIRNVYIKLIDPKTSKKYPHKMRFVEAIVEIDGVPRAMEFLTNNMQWAASSICDLYKSRWGIEVFFKESWYESSRFLLAAETCRTHHEWMKIFYFRGR